MSKTYFFTIHLLYGLKVSAILSKKVSKSGNKINEQKRFFDILQHFI